MISCDDVLGLFKTHESPTLVKAESTCASRHAPWAMHYSCMSVLTLHNHRSLCKLRTTNFTTTGRTTNEGVVIHTGISRRDRRFSRYHLTRLLDYLGSQSYWKVPSTFDRRWQLFFVMTSMVSETIRIIFAGHYLASRSRLHRSWNRLSTVVYISGIHSSLFHLHTLNSS